MLRFPVSPVPCSGFALFIKNLLLPSFASHVTEQLPYVGTGLIFLRRGDRFLEDHSCESLEFLLSHTHTHTSWTILLSLFIALISVTQFKLNFALMVLEGMSSTAKPIRSALEEDGSRSSDRTSGAGPEHCALLIVLVCLGLPAHGSGPLSSSAPSPAWTCLFIKHLRLCHMFSVCLDFQSH